jgi:hypothetical protein
LERWLLWWYWGGLMACGVNCLRFQGQMSKSRHYYRLLLGMVVFSQVTAVVDGFWRFLSTTNKSYGPKEDYQALLPVEAVGIHGPWDAGYCRGFEVVLGSGDNCFP